MDREHQSGTAREHRDSAATTATDHGQVSVGSGNSPRRTLNGRDRCLSRRVLDSHSGFGRTGTRQALPIRSGVTSVERCDALSYADSQSKSTVAA